MDFAVWSEAVAVARRFEAGDVTPAGQWANRVFLAANTRAIGVRDGQVMLECRFFDRDHQECRAYDRRPPMCSGFPWYGREPEPGRLMYGQCSYLLDVAASERPEGSRPLIPLTVAN